MTTAKKTEQPNQKSKKIWVKVCVAAACAVVVVAIFVTVALILGNSNKDGEASAVETTTQEEIYETTESEESKSSSDSEESKSGYSLGKINKSIAVLRESGYIDNENNITDSAMKLINASKPKSAVILAAGFGMRMVPLNSELPKGLIEVHGEPLIERTIRHLNEAGISDIYIVVGFMKEMYDYSIVL